MVLPRLVLPRQIPQVLALGRLNLLLLQHFCQKAFHSITAKARDAPGNTSPASTAVSVIVDTVKPIVAGINPTDGATGVAVSSNIVTTFSERMNPSTVTTSTFTVMDGATNVAGTVTLSLDGKIAYL